MIRQQTVYSFAIAALFGVLLVLSPSFFRSLWHSDGDFGQHFRFAPDGDEEIEVHRSLGHHVLDNRTRDYHGKHK